MKSILNIWMQPVHARMNLHGIRSLVILLSSVLVLSQIVAYVLVTLKNGSLDFKLHLIVLLGAAGFLFCILIFGWFVMLSMNVGLQYSPSNSKLVPRLKLRLQIALVLPILFIAFCATLIFGLLSQKWNLIPFLAVSAFLSFFIVMIRNQLALIPFLLLLQAPAYLEKNTSANPFNILESALGLSPDLQCFIFSILIISFALYCFFAVSEKAHFEMYQRAQVMKNGLQVQTSQENRVSLGFGMIYFRIMKYQVRATLMGVKDALRPQLLKYVFGPRIHWSTLFLQAVSMGLMIFIFFHLMELFRTAKSDFWDGFAGGFVWGFVGLYLLVLPCIFIIQMFARIYQTRSEQALLCLAPLAGNRQQIDRELYLYCLRQFAITFVLSILSGLFFLLQWKTIDVKSATLILTLTAVFPFVLVIPTAHAKMRSLSDHPIAWSAIPGAAVMVLGLASLIIFPFEIVFLYLVVVVLVTLGFLLRQWRKVRAQVQFPAGWAV